MLGSWIERIDQISEKYTDEFSKLSTEELNWKPGEHSWSIGQCMDHIITTNKQYFVIFEKLNNGTYKKHWVASIPFIPLWFGGIILKSVKPETIHKKMKTFQVFEPSGNIIDKNVISRFEINQIKLKSYLTETSSSKYKEIVSSPVNQVIVYPLSKAIEIIIAHEERHFLQAQKVKEFMKTST